MKLLLLAWSLSVFGQLVFELLAKDQEGARKIEETTLEHFLIPTMSGVPSSRILPILEALYSTTTFKDLANPTVSPLDSAWAGALWPADPAVAREANDLLWEVAHDRDPELP